MKPELVFPVILASYSEDKIARELLNNDSMIKTAGLFDIIRKLFSKPVRPTQQKKLLWNENVRREAAEAIDARLARQQRLVSPTPDQGGPPSPSAPATSPSAPAASPSAPAASPSAQIEQGKKEHTKTLQEAKEDNRSIKEEAKSIAPAPKTDGQEEQTSPSTVNTTGVDRGKQLGSVIQKFIQNPNAADPDTIIANLKQEGMSTDEMEKAIKLMKKYKNYEFISNELYRNGLASHDQQMLRVSEDYIREKDFIANELRAYGITPKILQEVNPDSLNPLLKKLNIAKRQMQAVGTNQAANAAQPANAAKPADAANPAGANQTAEAENKGKGSSILSKIIAVGGATGAGALAHAMLSANRDEQKSTNEKIIRSLAGNKVIKDQSGPEQNKGGNPEPKTEINPLLAAGLGALLVGGLSQRRYGNDEGQYNSLGDALLPMLAGGLVGYGGAEAINRYSA